MECVRPDETDVDGASTCSFEVSRPSALRPSCAKSSDGKATEMMTIGNTDTREIADSNIADLGSLEKGARTAAACQEGVQETDVAVDEVGGLGPCAEQVTSMQGSHPTNHLSPLACNPAGTEGETQGTSTSVEDHLNLPRPASHGAPCRGVEIEVGALEGESGRAGLVPGAEGAPVVVSDTVWMPHELHSVFEMMGNRPEQRAFHRIQPGAGEEGEGQGALFMAKSEQASGVCELFKKLREAGSDGGVAQWLGGQESAGAGFIVQEVARREFGGQLSSLQMGYALVVKYLCRAL
jgi:hypothetical protein